MRHQSRIGTKLLLAPLFSLFTPLSPSLEIPIPTLTFLITTAQIGTIP
jgi:hypothetical protein